VAHKRLEGVDGSTVWLLSPVGALGIWMGAS